MAAKKNQKKAKNQPAKDIAKVEKKKKADELSDEQLDKVAGGREPSAPKVSEIVVTKRLDSASPKLSFDIEQ